MKTYMIFWDGRANTPLSISIWFILFKQQQINLLVLSCTISFHYVSVPFTMHFSDPTRLFLLLRLFFFFTSRPLVPVRFLARAWWSAQAHRGTGNIIYSGTSFVTSPGIFYPKNISYHYKFCIIGIHRNLCWNMHK